LGDPRDEKNPYKSCPIPSLRVKVRANLTKSQFRWGTNMRPKIQKKKNSEANKQKKTEDLWTDQPQQQIDY